ncbi:MAG TPA: hypothetical protein VFD63_07130, partial [Pyrinomonadaceae bacterium]|nr:hypothetical protein [Pyrinomonadaceae bacterium]
CQHYSTASEATGWHTQRINHQNLGVVSSVPSGRFGSRYCTDRLTLTKSLEFLCKAPVTEQTFARHFAPN